MKNSHTPENPGHDQKDFQNENKDIKTTGTRGNPYDSENLGHESDSSSKNITEQAIEKDLIENNPSKGFETHIDKSKSSNEESDAFETIEPDNDNPVNREFEIGQLGNEELQEDERTRDDSDSDAVHFHKPSERKF